MGLGLGLVLAAASALAGPPTEYQVKAAFLLNFARFVEWPPRTFPDTNAPLVIGIVGDNPIGAALPQVVQGQTAQGRRIEIRQLSADGELGGCQILFLSAAVTAPADLLKRLSGKPVLTVGETEDFVRQGGMLGFALVDQSVRFDANAKATAAAELKVSAKLMAVARSVIK